MSKLLDRMPLQVLRTEVAPDSSPVARSAAGVGRATSAISASTPPSPSLSARMTKARYLTDTTRVMAQNTSDSTPKMLPSTAATPCGSVTHSRTA